MIRIQRVADRRGDHLARHEVITLVGVLIPYQIGGVGRCFGVGDTFVDLGLGPVGIDQRLIAFESRTIDVDIGSDSGVG